MPSKATGARVAAAIRYYEWILVCLLASAAYLNQFDRQTLSVLKTTLKTVFHYDDAGYALLVNCFLAAYTASYIFSGWIVDRFGTRKALAVFIFLWSTATVFCGFVDAFWQLALCRCLLGLFEPGLYPAMNKVAALWVPDKRRATFISLAGLGSTVAKLSYVPVIAWLTTTWSWRLSFVVPGLIGILLASFWYILYRDPELEWQPQLEALNRDGENAEKCFVWSQLWKQRALWVLGITKLVSDPVWFFLLFWLPGYLQESKGVSLSLLGRIGWIPLVVANLLGVGILYLNDNIWGRNSVINRKWLFVLTACFSPLCILIPYADSLPLTIALFIVTGTVSSVWLPCFGPLIAQLFPKGNVGAVFGIVGAFGALGAIAVNFLAGQAGSAISPKVLFLVLGMLHPIAAAVMFFILKAPAPSEEKG
jgi:ACS family hexuronate transporter-like MFS transporter